MEQDVNTPEVKQPAGMDTIHIEMVAEDAKRVERAAINAGMSFNEFVVNTLMDVCKEE